MRAFVPSTTPNVSIPESDLVESLILADFEALEESCALIESMSLDVGDVRLSLARGFDTPAEHGGIPCLSIILDFVQHGDYSPLWKRFGAAEEGRKQKAFDVCKSACIKSVVEVAGEEGNENVLWDESDDHKPGGEFACRMVEWVKAYASEKDSRDDLVICGTLSLGNLARRSQSFSSL